jgi:hypothetical protein
MLPYLDNPRNDRKLRLFAIACCRTIGATLQDDVSRQAIEAAEQFADGLIQLRELDIAWVRLARMRGGLNRKSQAACAATDRTGFGAAREVSRTLASIAGDAAAARGRDRTKAVLIEQQQQVRLVYDIFGNPFRPVTIDPAWRTTNVVGLAQAIYDERAFDRIPILADALEDAGCDNADILNHCRQPTEHVRGCWVVDLLLDKK